VLLNGLSLVGRFLSTEQKLQFLGLLKEVTFGELRRKALLRYYRLHRKQNRIGPEAFVSRSVAVIVDLGANVGEFTKVAAGIADEVHAYEPDPVTFEILKMNMAHLSNVHVHQAAVGTENGECRLFRRPDFEVNHAVASEGSSVFASHKGVTENDFVVTPQVSIETLLKQIGRPVDIMKVDIEGAEVPVLERLFASPLVSNVRELYVETHEFALPELAERTETLRKRARKIKGLTASFDWH
jgi:FkbM family methyltransferase